jgi:hypothetical protein
LPEDEQAAFVADAYKFKEPHTKPHVIKPLNFRHLPDIRLLYSAQRSPRHGAVPLT